MMGNTVRVDQMTDAIMQGLTEYAKLANADMKKAVKNATVRRKQSCLTATP